MDNQPSQFEVLARALSDPDNIFFALVIIAVIVVGIIFAITKRAENFKRFMPSLAVSIGIFGTFWGIFIGLSGFDTNNISKSIPLLLEGMKTAFVTSILGMFASICLKILYAAIDDKTSKAATNPMKCFQNIEIGVSDTAKSVGTLSGTIERYFKSEEEYSFISQIKLIRMEIIQSRNEIKLALQEFAAQFSKMASESLVDELKKVVDKFNAMLSDLVGQSFRDLKESTERLNTWQAQYKEEMAQNHKNLTETLSQLAILNDTYKQSLIKLEELRQEINVIAQNLKDISNSGADIAKQCITLAEQNTLLEASIQSIKLAGEKAAQVVPELSNKLNVIITDISKLNNEVGEFVASTTKQLKDSTEQISKASQDQITSIEKSLETELKKSMDSFAGMMVALSQKFASDYLPLTERLREILTIAQQVRNDKP